MHFAIEVNNAANMYCFVVSDASAVKHAEEEITGIGSGSTWETVAKGQVPVLSYHNSDEALFKVNVDIPVIR